MYAMKSQYDQVINAMGRQLTQIKKLQQHQKQLPKENALVDHHEIAEEQPQVRPFRESSNPQVLGAGGTGGVGNVASNRTHSNQQSRVETLTDSNAGNSKRARDGLSKDKPDSFRKVLSSI